MTGIKGWIKDILIACIIALVIITFIKPTIIRENSMQPTLFPNDFILLSRQAYLFSEPERGDIVVFNSELPAENGGYKLFIKRVIALPGDSITISGGNVYINGLLIEEPYILKDETLGFIENLKIPERAVFVMGDNRFASIDSRDGDIGVVSFDMIVGRAFFRLHPFNSIGFIAKTP